MALFRLQAINDDQMKHLTRFLHIVDAEGDWEALNNLLQPILDSPLTSVDAFEVAIRKGGSVYFNYLQQRLQTIQKWTSYVYVNPDKTSFRHVWFTVEKDLIVLLSKSAVWIDNLADCLTNAKRYKPALDYVDTENEPPILLSFENKTTPGIGIVCEKSRPIYDCFSFTDSFYRYKIVDDFKVVQLPWTINDSVRKLYIYCLEYDDVWFYSHSSKIVQAFHDHCYHS